VGPHPQRINQNKGHTIAGIAAKNNRNRLT